MSLNNPTKAERRWLEGIVDLGCIVCALEGNPNTPAEPHHMLSGGRRMGHMFCIPLCYAHHRSGRDDERVTSRDHNQPRFEARYGPEIELLAAARVLVCAKRDVMMGYPRGTTHGQIFGNDADPHLPANQDGRGGGVGLRPKAFGVRVRDGNDTLPERQGNDEGCSLVGSSVGIEARADLDF